MINVKEKVVVNKPVEYVWHELSDKFVDVEDWVPEVYASRKGTPEEEADRVCDTKFGKLQENLLKNDKATHTLSYQVNGLPFIISSAINSWSLKKISENETEVTLNANFKLSPIFRFLISSRFEKRSKVNLPRILNDFKIYVETGKPSERKLEAMKKTND